MFILLEKEWSYNATGKQEQFYSLFSVYFQKCSYVHKKEKGYTRTHSQESGILKENSTQLEINVPVVQLLTVLCFLEQYFQ